MAYKKSMDILETDLHLSEEDSEDEVHLQIREGEEEALLAPDDDDIGLRVQVTDDPSTTYSTSTLSSYSNVQVQGTQNNNGQRSATIASTSRGLQMAARTENSNQYGTPNNNIEMELATMPPPPPPTARPRLNEPTTSKGFQRFGGVQRNIGRNNTTRIVHTNRPQNEERHGRLRESIRSAIQGNPSTDIDEEQNRLRNLNISPDPWSIIIQLGERGHHIFWQVYKLTREYINREELKGRTYRCMVKLDDIIGVCESSGMFIARQGAAVNFLEKFDKKFPSPFGQGPLLPTKLEKHYAMPANNMSMECFRNRFYEKHNRNFMYRFESLTEKVGDKTVNIEYLWIDEEKFEGRSSGNSVYSRFAAILAAYEATLQEPFPVEPVYMGEEVRKTEEGLFKQESQKTHSHDFTLYDKKQPSDIRTAQTIMGRGRARPAATISYAGPSNLNTSPSNV